MRRALLQTQRINYSDLFGASTSELAAGGNPENVICPTKLGFRRRTARSDCGARDTPRAYRESAARVRAACPSFQQHGPIAVNPVQ
jgi:hypothetical protein